MNDRSLLVTLVSTPSAWLYRKHMPEKFTVCHFGGYSPDYSRNIVIRKSLELNGTNVIQCCSRNPLPGKRLLELTQRYLQMYRKVDLILVGTVGHFYVPLAFLLGRLTQKPVVFDVFDSLFETYRYDQNHSGRFRAGYYALVDRLSCALVDLVVLDTDEHADFFANRLGVERKRMRSVPVGTDTDLFYPGQEPHLFGKGSYNVLFAGSFNNMHGVDTIVRAANRLIKTPKIRLHILGAGLTKPYITGLVRSSHNTNIDFIPPVPYDVLPGYYSSADIVLGVFGNTPKIQRVVPNKVYEALATKKPLITGDTQAIRARLTNRLNVLLSPLGDEQALAENICCLMDNTLSASNIANEGYDLFMSKYTLAAIGLQWQAVLGEVVK